jgi:hypothetical protein
LLVIAMSLATSHAYAKFLPDNQLHLLDRKDAGTGITQDQFNAVIDHANQIFGPIVATFGATLNINPNWDDPTVNADSEQYGTDWEVNMYGGLARRPEITVDGFALVLCHELGHHMGGFPFFSGDVMADEGQADYFATTHCAQLIWAGDPANANARADIPAPPKSLCDGAWSAVDAQNLCYRTALAGKSLGDLGGALHSTTVDFSTPDPSVVDQTFDDHPAAQCRLDTYVAGATCIEPWDTTVIPGKENGVGSNDATAEAESGKYYCEGATQIGVRPRCWFKP